MWIVSAVSLAIVMALCVVGVFIPKRIYDDNLAQCVGMAGVFMFSWPRLAHLLDHQEITSIVIPALAQTAGHVGLALYALGTAYKAWKHRPRPEGASPPARRVTDISGHDMLRIFGRGRQ